MTMKNIFLTIGLIGCFVLTFGILKVRNANANLNGNWSGLVATTNGGCALDYKFEAIGNHLIGTAVSPQGEASIVDGTINGTDIEFTISFKGSEVKHSGKYYATDNSIAMDLDLGGATLHTTLKKAI
jgi:hypothetical protein